MGYACAIGFGQVDEATRPTRQSRSIIPESGATKLALRRQARKTRQGDSQLIRRAAADSIR
jgi:hypothetical protein